MLRRWIALTLCVCINVSPVYADEFNLLEDKPPTKNGAAEFTFQPYPGAALMPVNLWGSIGHGGIYRIPVHTDLYTLLSLAGGPSESAELSEISIQRSDKSGQRHVQLINLESNLKSKTSGPIPTLEPNDVIFIPKKEPLISSNTMLTLTVVSTALTIIVSYFTIKALTKN